jgi:type IV pilus assembly protein PilQ
MSYESCPGCVVELDPRTNTIFIRTYPYYLEQFTAVINALDKPTPAVLVEARIVRVASSSEMALGIQWGATYAADAAHGNAPPYAFPNSVAVGGTQGVGNYLVNLPIAAASGGIGVSLGHIADVFSLDLKLSAMEQMGKAKLLSNPKLLVMQGKSANIQIGQDLPMITTTTDSNGAQTSSVEWRSVGIMLNVTPIVTNDKRIGLRVEIEQSNQGQNVTTTEGQNFSVDVSRVVTEVLIEDGSTAVIGGLLEQSTSDGTEGVPGFSDIPLIGWLFKTKKNSSAAREILVFLTPRIVGSAP